MVGFLKKKKSKRIMNLRNAFPNGILLYTYQLEVYCVMSRGRTVRGLPKAEKTGSSRVEGNFTDDKFNLVISEAKAVLFLPSFCYLLVVWDKSNMTH